MSELVAGVYRRYLPLVFTGKDFEKSRLPGSTGIYKYFIDFSLNCIVDTPSYSLCYTWTP